MASRVIKKMIKTWWDGPHMSQIEPNLFIGHLQSSQNIDSIVKNEIGAILSVYRKRLDIWNSEDIRALVPESRHMFVPCLDSPQQDLLQHLQGMCDFIEEQRRDGMKVLVHCNAGESRSVTVVMAYLMRRDGRDLESAFEVILRGRRKARPNVGFVEQLEIWQETGYQVWVDVGVPKEPYGSFLRKRGIE